MMIPKKKETNPEEEEKYVNYPVPLAKPIPIGLKPFQSFINESINFNNTISYNSELDTIKKMRKR